MIAAETPNRLEEEKAELESLLASGYFAASSNPARFLQFVCACYFAGRTESATETAIAIEALGRRPDFDPKLDAIVRVEAHRVRKRLREFYEGTGRTHAIEIVIPAGHYVPQFVSRGGVAASAPESNSTFEETEAPLRKRLWRFRWMYYALGILIVTALVVVGWVQRHTKHEPAVQQTPAHVSTQVAVGTPQQNEVRVLAGSSVGNYTDRAGEKWSSDAYFNGGETVRMSYRRIAGTEDPTIFLSSRQGRDFRYDIPLVSGVYELRLYFAETIFGEDNQEGGGESSRMFNVTLNDQPILTSFDPLSDAGVSNAADVRVFKGVSPAGDGQVHLHFFVPFAAKNSAIVSGIEITPSLDHRMNPLRWTTAEGSYVDSTRLLWTSDRYFQGGRRRLYTNPIANTADPDLYHSERFGHFTYAIPVAKGTYSIRLYFAENWFGVPGGGGAGNGHRLFDVYCNGVALMRTFDIYKEAGGSLRAVSKTFNGLHSNAQGKLLLSFVPVIDYASVDAIEVWQDAD